MDRKLVKDYAIVTGLVWLVFWGGCVAISQLFDCSVKSPFLFLPYVLGGFSPTIGSYVALKRSGRVASFGKWLKRIFDVRHGWKVYLLTAAYAAIYFGLGGLLSGCKRGAPLWMLPAAVSMMLFGGGNEEAGWRMVLQPELEKRIGFHGATIAVGAVWWLWHLPLFFMKDMQHDGKFFLFGITCLALAYALATVRKISDGVFPCVLLHCLINGLGVVFVLNGTLSGSLAVLIATVLLSAVVFFVNARKAKGKA